MIAIVEVDEKKELKVKHMVMGKSTRQKRLLYLAVYDPHVPLTGTGMRGAEFVNRFSQHYDVDLIYIDGSGQPPIPELSMKYSSRIKGVRSKTVVDFSRPGYFIFSSVLYRKATRLLEKFSHDYILCDYGLSALYGLLLSHKFKIPFIYCSHNIEHRGYLDKARKDIRRLLLAGYVYMIERAGVMRSKVLVPITQEDAQHYTKWTDRNKMLVVPQGFDEKVFNPFYKPSNNHPQVVLFCGNYNIQFNREVVDVVMNKILEKVLAECPNTKFLFIGANPPQNIDHPNVEFTGFVDDYPTYLKKADVVISPMVQGRGSPTKIFEALACGKPIVSTPVGARSLENDYATLNITDINGFPDMICSVLKSGRSVNTDGFEKIRKRYAWEKTINKLIEKIEFS